MTSGLLPAFPDFAPLSLEHGAAIEEAREQAQPEASELTFPEIFAWRRVRQTQITDIDGAMGLFILRHGQRCFYPPIGARDPVRTMHRMLSWLRQQGEDGFVYGLTGDVVTRVQTDDMLVAEEDVDNADYVYRVQDLIRLPGHRYDGKRNHINHFLQNNDFTFSRLKVSEIPELIDFENRWYTHRHRTDPPGLAAENQAILELLRNYGNLPVEGAVVRIRGRIEAFSIATELNRNTAVVIAEKANHEIRGLYQAINQMFCEHFLARYTWVNREQDTGDLGLRRAKLSYHPHHMVAKYRVRLRRSS